MRVPVPRGLPTPPGAVCAPHPGERPPRLFLTPLGSVRPFAPPPGVRPPQDGDDPAPPSDAPSDAPIDVENPLNDTALFLRRTPLAYRVYMIAISAVETGPMGGGNGRVSD